MSLKNNNPGNIRVGPDFWEGQSPVSAGDTFCRFDEPEHGLRAILKTLQSYQNKHGLRTLRGWIYRWAPPSDNNPTNSYLYNVAKWCDVSPDDCIDINDKKIALGCLRGITMQENGIQPYSDDILAKAASMAGITTQTNG